MKGEKDNFVKAFPMEEELNNLVPYTHPSAAFSDRNSFVALSWPDGDYSDGRDIIN